MKKDNNQAQEPDKTLAAVCGLYCEGCTLYIATREDPERLTALAKRFQLSEEEMRCNGCRSDKHGPYCQTCKMIKCAAEKGIDFCSQCDEYPCTELKQFQAERPHRIELWEDLERLKTVSPKQWIHEKREHYSCPECRTINSAYDAQCRKCGNEPSCGYTEKHGEAIREFMKNV